VTEVSSDPLTTQFSVGGTSDDCDPDRTETVRQPGRRDVGEGDHGHERGDRPVGNREQQAEQGRIVGNQFHGYTLCDRSDAGNSRRSMGRISVSGRASVNPSRPRPNGRRDPPGTSRAQANLAALAAALFALTTVTALGVAAANGALVGEFRDTGERHAATAVADRIVADGSPVTNRSNVLERGAVASLDAATLRSRYPALDGRSFRVTVDGRVVAAAGTPDGGTTRHRVVLVERRRNETVTPSFSGPNRVALPRRTPWARLDIGPPDNVSISAVRANERTVLRDTAGLDGRYTVSLSRRETVQFTFIANSSLDRGDVTLTFAPSNTTKARLGVTVDD
jgi:hypothetical protein